MTLAQPRSPSDLCCQMPSWSRRSSWRSFYPLPFYPFTFYFYLFYPFLPFFIACGRHMGPQIYGTGPL